MWQPQRSSSCGKRTSLESVSQCAGPAGALVASTVFNSARLDFQLLASHKAGPSSLPSARPSVSFDLKAASCSQQLAKRDTHVGSNSGATSCSKQLSGCETFIGSNLGAISCRQLLTAAGRAMPTARRVQSFSWLQPWICSTLSIVKRLAMSRLHILKHVKLTEHVPLAKNFDSNALCPV